MNIGTKKQTLTACSTVEAEPMTVIRFGGKENTRLYNFNLELSPLVVDITVEKLRGRSITVVALPDVSYRRCMWLYNM